MATRKESGPKKAARPDRAERIVDAAMALAAERRWREISLSDIAAQAKLELVELYDHYPSKVAILAALSRRIDRLVLAGLEADDAAEPPRERLLDVIMRRLEALSPYKAALGSVLRGTGCDPLALVCLGPRFLRSMAWSLEAAGIGTSGPRGRLRIKGLALIYLSTLRVWLRDDSDDMGATMAHLDRALRRAERLSTGFPLASPAAA
jgi:AcrR family transcriptional regulator